MGAPGPSSWAEGKGFEPLVRGYRTLVFKTSSLGRSDNLPDRSRPPAGAVANDTSLFHVTTAQGQYDAARSGDARGEMAERRRNLAATVNPRKDGGRRKTSSEKENPCARYEILNRVAPRS